MSGWVLKKYFGTSFIKQLSFYNNGRYIRRDGTGQDGTGREGKQIGFMIKYFFISVKAIKKRYNIKKIFN